MARPVSRSIWFPAVHLSVIAAVVAGAVTPAAAVDLTDQINVNATVTNSCQIDSVGSLDFGELSGKTTQVSASAQVTVSCTIGALAGATLSIDDGVNETEPSVPKMSNGVGATIRYQLYKNSSHTELWLSGETVDITFTGSTGAATVYGVIPISDVTGVTQGGTYTDTITATFSY